MNLSVVFVPNMHKNYCIVINMNKLYLHIFSWYNFFYFTFVKSFTYICVKGFSLVSVVIVGL